MLPKNAITWGGDVVLDKAIWMSWYDLPEQGREGYLSWLHETYIPKITQQPGVRWAAHYASNKVPPAARLTPAFSSTSLSEASPRIAMSCRLRSWWALMRAREPASSMTSIALSGRNRLGR